MMNGVNIKGSPQPQSQSPIDFKLYPQRFIQLGLVSILGLINTLLCYSISPTIHVANQVYGFDTDLTQIISLFFIIYVIFSFPTSWALERYGLQTMVRLAAWTQALGSIIRCIHANSINNTYPYESYLSFFSPFTWLMIGQSLCALASCCWTNIPSMLAQSFFGSSERNLATSVAVNCVTLGIAAAYLSSPYMVAVPSDIQFYLICCAAITVGAAIVTTFMFTERPLTPPSLSEHHRLLQIAFDTQQRLRQHENGDLGRRRRYSSDDSGSVISETSTLLPVNELPPSPLILQPLDLSCHLPSLHVQVSPRGDALTSRSTSMSRTQFRQLLHLFSHAGFLHTVAAFSASECLINIFAGFMLLILKPDGFKSKVIGHITAAFVVSCLFGSAVIGSIVDRYKIYQSTLIVSFAATSIAVAGVVLSETSTIWTTISVCICGLTMGSIQPIALESAVEVTWPSDASAVAAVLQSIGNALSAASFPLLMMMRENDNGRMDNALYLMSIILAVLAITFFFFNGEFNRTKIEQQQERSAMAEWKAQLERENQHQSNGQDESSQIDISTLDHHPQRHNDSSYQQQFNPHTHAQSNGI